MKQKFFAFAGLLVLILSAAAPASAQSEAFDNFVEKQFYGNRIKAGSVLLNGSFQRDAYDSPDRDGVTGRIGIGAGIGLGENIALSFGYQRDRAAAALFNGQGFPTQQGLITTNSLQAGVRFLPNTVGGFIQPYVGLDFVWSKSDSRPNRDSDAEELGRFGGFSIPVGVIIWISDFMSVSLQPLSISVLGNFGDDEDYDAEFNADLNMLNPTFGISFLLNGRKP